jgi:hypothetical protein
MKLMFFNDFRLGVLRDEEVVDVTPIAESVPHVGPHDLISGVIEQFDTFRPRLEAAAKTNVGGDVHSTADLQVIENKNVSGAIYVIHSGVTIRNCRWVGMLIEGGASTVVEDCDLAPWWVLLTASFSGVMCSVPRTVFSSRRPIA